MVAAFKALLVYFGKRDSEAEADKLNSDNFFTLLVDFVSDGLPLPTHSHIPGTSFPDALMTPSLWTCAFLRAHAHVLVYAQAHIRCHSHPGTTRRSKPHVILHSSYSSYS